MAVEYFQDKFLTLYHGDCRDMCEIPDNSVHVCITSPPYLSKRIYKLEPLIWGYSACPHEWGKEIPLKGAHHAGETNPGKYAYAKDSGQFSSTQGQFCQLCGSWKGHLGLEPDPESYLRHLIEIFREVRRVLRPDGVLWVNISDTHAGGGNNRGSSPDNLSDKQLSNRGAHGGEEAAPVPKGLHPGDLIGIPWRFALAMQADGWRLRQDIIWQKPSCMPESVNGVRWERCRVKVKSLHPDKIVAGVEHWNSGGKNLRETEWADCPGCPICAPNDGLVLRRGNWRPTVSHEYIFMFAKSEYYYADREAVKELQITAIDDKSHHTFGAPNGKLSGEYGHFFSGEKWDNTGSGRNKRSVWTIGPEPFTGSTNGVSHFAAYPTELPSICIKASTSEVGVCPKCGAQWARVIEHNQPPDNLYTKTKNPDDGFVSGQRRDGIYRGSGQKVQDWISEHPTKTLSWRPTCKCGEIQTIPATVLDPFAGTFTTGEAAVKLGRRCIGYELSEDYCKLAQERNNQGGLL